MPLKKNFGLGGNMVGRKAGGGMPRGWRGARPSSLHHANGFLTSKLSLQGTFARNCPRETAPSEGKIEISEP